MLKIIAEIGINHNGNFDLIDELVRQAALGGADYAKFQLYSSQIVFGDDSRKHNEFTFEQVKEIKETCEFYGIEFFASVFDSEKLLWCEELGVNLYKIASRTLKNDAGLCKKIIDTGKPVLASLGAFGGCISIYDHKEIYPFGNENVIYMNCVAKYPTKIGQIKPEMFYFNDGYTKGWSDHYYGISACLHAISQGAQWVEKHFTISKSMPGHDHIGSMDLEELKILSTYGRELSKVANYVRNNI